MSSNVDCRADRDVGRVARLTHIQPTQTAVERQVGKVKRLSCVKTVGCWGQRDRARRVDRIAGTIQVELIGIESQGACLVRMSQ